MNPGAAEDGTDPVDDDCDDSPLTRRAYVTGFELNYTNDWNVTGTVMTVGPGMIRLWPTATTPASVALKRDFSWVKGLLTVNVRFAEAPTTACSVIVAGPTSSASQSLGAPTGAKTVSVTFPLILPDQTVTDVKLSCAGAGTALVDWLTVQNGPYAWAPLMDIGMSFTTMGVPGTGHGTFVRMSEDEEASDAIRFIGSDVGGIAWSDDGQAWHTANGTMDDLNTQSKGGVWDAWSPGELGGAYFTAILVGNKGDSGAPGVNGGLYYTDDITDPLQTWTLVPSPDNDPLYGGIGATKKYDECGAIVTEEEAESGVASAADDNPTSSGKLLLESILDGGLLVGSDSAAYPGVYVWDPNDPTTPPHHPFTLEADFATTGYQPLPTAFAIGGEELDVLLVGYRVRAGGGANQPALYVCILPPTGLLLETESVLCDPVADDTTGLTALDVRDIELTTAEDGTVIAYVADGGHTYDGLECGEEETTIFEVKLTTAGAMSVVDTDSTDPDPAWTTWACGDNNHADTSGDLVPPEGGNAQGSELSSTLLSPQGEWLFAFFPQKASKRDYGCPRVFRAEVDPEAGFVGPWLPFQGYEAGQMQWNVVGGHSESRRGTSNMKGSVFATEPLPEAQALASVDDAAWEPPMAADPLHPGQKDQALLTNGLTFWRVYSAYDSITGFGWDTVPAAITDHDLDTIDVELAWDGASDVYQSGQGVSMGVCRGCEARPTESLDYVFGGVTGDYGPQFLHARDATGAREAAQHPCAASSLRAIVAASVSVWEDPAGVTPAQVWIPMRGHNGDAAARRGLLFLDDADTEDWCFDGYGEGYLATTNYLNDVTYSADGVWELLCQDSYDVGGYVPWATCDSDISTPEIDSFNMTTAGIGNITGVVALAEDYAIAAAAHGGVVTATTYSEGLWVLHNAGATGIEYTHVGFPGGLSTGCSEEDTFLEAALTNLTVDFEALDASGGSGDVTAYFTNHSSPCGGVWKITFNYLTPGTAVWTELPVGDGTGPCALFDEENLYGAQPTADGRYVYVYGKSGVCRADMLTNDALDFEVAFPSLTITNVTDVLPHPHLDDVFWVAVQGGDDASSAPGGLYLAQRRFRPGVVTPPLGPPVGTWQYGFVKQGYYDLEDRRVNTLDWGTGYGRYAGDDLSSPLDDHLSNVYLSVLGGSWWDGAVEAE